MIYIFSGYHFETARKCVNNNKGEVLQWKYEKTEKRKNHAFQEAQVTNEHNRISEKIRY